MLSKVEIRGFKSFAFDSEPVTLGPLNVIVGANGSGKSNFLAALKFLQATVRAPIGPVLAEFGGAKSLINRTRRVENSDGSSEVSIAVKGDDSLEYSDRKNPESQFFVYQFQGYEYELGLSAKDSLTEVQMEHLRISLALEENPLRPFEVARTLDSISTSGDILNSSGESHLEKSVRSRTYLATAFQQTPALIVRDTIDRWKFLSVNVESSRSSLAGLNGDLTVGSNGQFLTLALERLKTSASDRFVQFVNDLRSILPYIKDLSFNHGASEEILMEISEQFLSQPISLSNLSDGTVRVIALLAQIAMSMEHGRNTQGLLCIEEPEQQLHPHLSEALVSILRRASKDVQIIVTTHSPSLLDQLEPSEVILCESISGATRMKNASTVADIEIFRNDFSLGELWTQGAIGAVS